MSCWDGDDYQARFDALEADGIDIHGEARFVASMNPRSVLDAGCGTGRLAIELARHGVEVAGVDADASMIAAARKRAPDLEWLVADLTTLDIGRRFDVVVMAGNVPLFTAPGTHAALIAGCARHVQPNGSLISGFQLGRGYDLATYDEHCEGATMTLVERWSTWDRRAFGPDADYAVSVHSPRSRVAR